MKILSIVAGVISFLICVIAGWALLNQSGLSFSKENVLLTSLGLYFIGQGVFAGAALILLGNHTE